jgi:hypothetical protein
MRISTMSVTWQLSTSSQLHAVLYTDTRVTDNAGRCRGHRVSS